MNTKYLPHERKRNLVAYLLGSTSANGKARPKPPQVLGEANGDLITLGIAANGFKNKIVSISHAWQEPLAVVGLELPTKVADQYRSLVTGDLSPDSFLHFRVLHERTSGGFDIHDVYGTTHLPSGREFPSFCNTTEDWELLRTFVDLANTTNGWTSPYDPALSKLRHRAPKDYDANERKLFDEFDVGWVALIKYGTITSRDAGVKELMKDGFNIEADDQSVTIKYESKVYTFRGGKYRRDFDYRPHGPHPRKIDDLPTPELRAKQIEILTTKLDELRAQRQLAIGGRFGGRFFSFAAPDKHQLPDGREGTAVLVTGAQTNRTVDTQSSGNCGTDDTHDSPFGRRERQAPSGMEERRNEKPASAATGIAGSAESGAISTETSASGSLGSDFQGSGDGGGASGRSPEDSPERHVARTEAESDLLDQCENPSINYEQNNIVSSAVARIRFALRCAGKALSRLEQLTRTAHQRTGEVLSGTEGNSAATSAISRELSDLAEGGFRPARRERSDSEEESSVGIDGPDPYRAFAETVGHFGAVLDEIEIGPTPTVENLQTHPVVLPLTFAPHVTRSVPEFER